MIETTIIKLTPEEARQRIERMQTYINRDTEHNPPSFFPEFSPVELLDLQRNHWRKLHTTRMTADELEEWVVAIPGCSSCRKDFLRILQDHPPIYDDWEKWTWTVHNVVNTKLGKQLIAWTDAIELWGWPIKDIPKDGSTENAGDSKA